jgi:hypothetical protein
MKFVTYLDGHLRVGVVVDSRVVDLSERFDSMLALIEEGESALEEARSFAEKADPLAQIAEVELRAPIPHPRRNVFCMGWNYLTHFEEGQGRRGGQGKELPEYPTFFDKPTTTVIGPYDDIPFDPNFSEKMDYEAELAVVIGRTGRRGHGLRLLLHDRQRRYGQGRPAAPRRPVAQRQGDGRKLPAGPLGPYSRRDSRSAEPTGSVSRKRCGEAELQHQVHGLPRHQAHRGALFSDDPVARGHTPDGHA